MAGKNPVSGWESTHHIVGILTTLIGAPLGCLAVCQATHMSRLMQMSTGTMSAIASRLIIMGIRMIRITAMIRKITMIMVIVMIKIEGITNPTCNGGSS